MLCWLQTFPMFSCSRLKFDDERVTKEDMKRALEEQYGGEEEVGFFSFSVELPFYGI